MAGQTYDERILYQAKRELAQGHYASALNSLGRIRDFNLFPEIKTMLLAANNGRDDQRVAEVRKMLASGPLDKNEQFYAIVELRGVADSSRFPDMEDLRRALGLDAHGSITSFSKGVKDCHVLSGIIHIIPQTDLARIILRNKEIDYNELLKFIQAEMSQQNQNSAPIEDGEQPETAASAQASPPRVRPALSAKEILAGYSRSGPNGEALTHSEAIKRATHRAMAQRAGGYTRKARFI